MPLLVQKEASKAIMTTAAVADDSMSASSEKTFSPSTTFTSSSLLNESITALYKSVIVAVKASNSIPTEQEDYFYVKDTVPAFESAITTMREETLPSLMNDVVTRFQSSGQLPAALSNFTVDLSSEDALATSQFKLAELLDAALEQTDTCCRAHLRGETQGINTSSSSSSSHGAAGATANGPYIHIRQQGGLAVRPQASFVTPVNNDVTLDFKHVRHDDNDDDDNDDDDNVNLSPQPQEKRQSSHPYAVEIAQLVYAPVHLTVTPQLLAAVGSEPDGTALSAARQARKIQWIDTTEALQSLADVLATHVAFAVDLEHHSDHSYLGFTCLMQVSTRTNDYLIDTLKLRHAIGPVLRPVFVNPSIQKVLHGSNHDIHWLQRDFSIYVVNLFDTGQAARVLNYAGFSLAHLLKVHCQVLADKQYQLADWRKRPLTAEMTKYAAQDTSDLLYIYDRLRAECLVKTNATQADLLQTVLTQSTSIALSLYSRPGLPSRETSAKLVHKGSNKYHRRHSNTKLSASASHLFHALNTFRDTCARTADDAPTTLISNFNLVHLTTTAPVTVPALAQWHSKQRTSVASYHSLFFNQPETLVRLIASTLATYEAELERTIQSQRITRSPPPLAKHTRSFEKEPPSAATMTIVDGPTTEEAFPGWMTSKRQRTHASRSDSVLPPPSRPSIFAPSAVVSCGKDNTVLSTSLQVSAIHVSLAATVFCLAPVGLEKTMTPHRLVPQLSTLETASTSATTEADTEWPLSLAAQRNHHETVESCRPSKKHKMTTFTATATASHKVDLIVQPAPKQDDLEDLEDLDDVEVMDVVAASVTPFDYSQVGAAAVQMVNPETTEEDPSSKATSARVAASGLYNPFIHSTPVESGNNLAGRNKVTSDRHKSQQRMRCKPRSATFGH